MQVVATKTEHAQPSGGLDIKQQLWQFTVCNLESRQLLERAQRSRQLVRHLHAIPVSKCDCAKV